MEGAIIQEDRKKMDPIVRQIAQFWALAPNASYYLDLEG